ncbi:MAG: hypothetical protein ABH854_01355 [Candidatus Diapherotrites archaeon]
MNPLKLFFAPRHTVRDAYENPNLPLAFALVILPVIFSAGVALFFGISFELIALAFDALRDIIVWVFGGIVLYILLYVLKGKEIKGKIAGVLSAFSLLYVIQLVMLAALITGLMLAAPGLMSKVAELQKTAAQMDAGSILSELSSVQTAPEGALFMAIGITFAALGVLFLFAVYFFYSLAAEGGKSGRARNILVMVIFFGFLMLINSIL